MILRWRRYFRAFWHAARHVIRRVPKFARLMEQGYLVLDDLLTRSMRMCDDSAMKLDQKSKSQSHDEVNREHPLGGQAFDPSCTDPDEEYIR